MHFNNSQVQFKEDLMGTAEIVSSPDLQSPANEKLLRQEFPAGHPSKSRKNKKAKKSGLKEIL